MSDDQTALQHLLTENDARGMLAEIERIREEELDDPAFDAWQVAVGMRTAEDLDVVEDELREMIEDE